MESIVVRVDEKGRLVIPKKLRERLGLIDCYAELRIEGDKIVIKPIKSVANKFFGIFKVEKWPENLDDFLAEEVKKRWLEDM